MRGIPRIPCRYEEHTADLDDNRILLWTLHQVRRQVLRREKVRIELDRARRTLAGTITLEQCSPSECVNRLYHRLNADYAPMHGLCRFVLEQTGPGIQSGDREFIPFELNMPQLFETFVAEWLRANALPGMTVRCQHNAQLDANFEMKIHVDIVLCEEHSQRPVAVLDTKYKASEQPSEADLYQIAFYARELQVDRAMLVYPSAESEKPSGQIAALAGEDKRSQQEAYRPRTTTSQPPKARPHVREVQPDRRNRRENQPPERRDGSSSTRRKSQRYAANRATHRP
jgi:5-methylcytosine-specific restriction enzyme subunit McrC